MKDVYFIFIAILKIWKEKKFKILQIEFEYNYEKKFVYNSKYNYENSLCNYK